MEPLPVLMSPLAAQTWHQTLTSPVGRDKLFRLIQYACKLVRGAQAGRSSPASGTLAAQIHALESAVSTSRQMWRLLKWVSVYARPHRRPSGTGANYTRELCALVADGALFAYLVLDNIAFIRKTNVLPGDTAATTRRAAKFWLLAVLAQGAAAAHALRDALRMRAALRAQAKRVDADHPARATARAEERNMDRRVAAHTATVAKNAADAVVAGSLASTSPLHPAAVGAFGAFSSAVGLWQAWPRHVSTG